MVNQIADSFPAVLSRRERFEKRRRDIEAALKKSKEEQAVYYARVAQRTAALSASQKTNSKSWAQMFSAAAASLTKNLGRVSHAFAQPVLAAGSMVRNGARALRSHVAKGGASKPSKPTLSSHWVRRLASGVAYASIASLVGIGVMSSVYHSDNVSANNNSAATSNAVANAVVYAASAAQAGLVNQGASVQAKAQKTDATDADVLRVAQNVVTELNTMNAMGMFSKGRTNETILKAARLAAQSVVNNVSDMPQEQARTLERTARADAQFLASRTAALRLG